MWAGNRVVILTQAQPEAAIPGSETPGQMFNDKRGSFRDCLSEGLVGLNQSGAVENPCKWLIGRPLPLYFGHSYLVFAGEDYFVVSIQDEEDWVAGRNKSREKPN